MNRWVYPTLAATAILIGASSPALAQTRHVYRIDDLGSLGGDLVGVAINSQGAITGTAVLPDGTLHAFRWTQDGGLEDLGANGGRQSQGFAINDHGDVVGVYFDQSWQPHAFVASPGAPMQDLRAVYPQIFQPGAITNDGRLTGYTFQGHAFRTLIGGALQELSSYLSFGADMNAAGDVTGWGWHDPAMTQPETAFRYADPTGYVDLGTLGGSRSYGYSINDHGVVVGTSELLPGRVGHAFRAVPGMPMQDLGALSGGFAGGVSSAYGINQQGEIVGQSDASYGWTAFVYSDDEGMLDLKSRVPIGDRLTRSLHWGRDINGDGQIVVGYNGPGRYGTVRLTRVETVPAPSAAPTANPPVLTPPDGRMVSVSIDPHVTDAYDPEPICRITGVANSEGPVSGPDPDVEITHFLSVNLRARRSGFNTGRIYTIDLSCSNHLGATSTTSVIVTVPHDSSKD